MTFDPKQIIFDLYNIDVKLVRQLVGEVDLNFYVEDIKGEKFIFKMAHASHDVQHLEMENKAMEHVRKMSVPFDTPVPLLNNQGELISQWSNQCVRLLSWVDGRLWSEVNPHSTSLLYDVGLKIGQLNNSLKDFDHPAAHRDFEWDPQHLPWVKNALDNLEVASMHNDRKEKIWRIFNVWEKHYLPFIPQLPKQVCYLDANDNNVIVAESEPLIKGFIDFGDIVFTPRVNELAVALAYMCMGKNEPVAAAMSVIEGFVQHVSLSEEELEVLLPAMLARLAISVTFSAKRKNALQDNPYLNVSEAPAWALIDQLFDVPMGLIESCFRYAAGFEPSKNHKTVVHWLKKNQSTAFPICGKEKSNKRITVFDWSVGSHALGNVDAFHDVEMSTINVFRQMDREGSDLGIGRYDEPRPVYSTLEYARKSNDGPEWRTVHLGIDIFMRAGEPLYAPYEGEVVICHDDAGDKEYGPLLVLKHTPENGVTFYTLYGHNDPELLLRYSVGDKVKSGDRIALIGDYPENGNWVPHVHFQIMTDLLDYTLDFPGVAYPTLSSVWKSICPDPNLILQLDHPALTFAWPSNEELIERRKNLLSKNLSLSYQQPLQISRGYMQYLYAADGRRYLDTVNNVPHVGHQHPAVVRANQLQSAVLNTNTRYLHSTILSYAERLLAKLPPHLGKIIFVNSGSEANELALRMARNFKGANGILAMDHGYHGHTEDLVGISAYKCNGPGGRGLGDNVALLPVPDPFREKETLGIEKICENLIEDLKKRGVVPACLIHETILSCGGQLVLPAEYWEGVYRAAKRHDLVTIADEVQTGFGRIGVHFWAFELYNLQPDIVVMGKPMGNGHPLAAVAVTDEVADAFDNGMEFFSTFGGNPVSCAIGNSVLEVIEKENLQSHAKHMGEYLLQRLNKLKEQHQVIAEVRGHGLFLGVELVSDPDSRKPGPEKASYLINRMKDKGVLMSSDGPYHNVIKIKPPLCFDESDADFLLSMLEEVLNEDFMAVS